jgi:hypothetical protein
MAKITKAELKKFNAPLKKMKKTSKAKPGMTLDEAIKKYKGDMTKIPGFKTRGMDGKVSPKKKIIKKK